MSEDSDSMDEKKIFDRFNSARGIIGGVSPATARIIDLIQGQYPKLLPLVSDPRRFEGQTSPWMSTGATPLDERRISVEMVESKLTFPAAYISFSRENYCKGSTKLFVINLSFLAFVQHLWAHANQSGLSWAELKSLVSDMKVDGTRLRRGPHHSQPDLVSFVHGISFVLAHELSHALRGTYLAKPSHHEIPDWCLRHVQDETNADLCAVAMLLWSIDASPRDQALKRQERADLIFGIKLMLLGMRALDIVQGREQVGFAQASKFYSNGMPTPNYRIELIEDFERELDSLGLLANTKSRSKSLMRTWMKLDTRILGYFNGNRFK